MFRLAIVGRPNVGKSTLFNRLCGVRKAIVGDEPGITRDRIEGRASWRGYTFEVVDTGGLIPSSTDVLPVKILEQVEAAVAEADLLLLVVDARAGVTSLDEQLLPMLRRVGRPVWVVANKVDVPDLEGDAAAFYALGFPRVFPISAEHDRGLGDLLEAVAGLVPEAGEADAPADDGIAVAVVGRPNVGKSSLVNRLLGAERSIVSEIPGTTRDAVDTLIERDGARYRIVDTAGIRRKGKTEARTEKVSVVVARKSLERSKIALLVLDAAEGVTKLDAAIGGYADSSGCSVIVVLNKWDLVPKVTATLEEFADSIRRRMKFLAHAPIVSISALTGQRVDRLFPMIRKAAEARRQRIATGELNNLFVRDLAASFSARNPSNKLEVRYVTQARTDPPTFVVFTGTDQPLHFSTRRFLANRLREQFGFFAAPIRIESRTRKPRSR